MQQRGGKALGAKMPFTSDCGFCCPSSPVCVLFSQRTIDFCARIENTVNRLEVVRDGKDVFGTVVRSVNRTA